MALTYLGGYMSKADIDREDKFLDMMIESDKEQGKEREMLMKKLGYSNVRTAPSNARMREMLKEQEAKKAKE